MTRMLLLAALALACVLSLSPAFAMAYPPGQEGSGSALFHGLTLMTLTLVVMALFAATVVWSARYLLDRAPRWPGFALLASMIAVAVFGLGLVTPAFAQEASSTKVELSAAPWIELIRQILLTIVIPVVSFYVVQAVRKNSTIGALFLTQSRVEQLGNAATEFAINAIPGAVKEAKLSVNVGSAVIAKAVQYGIDAAPAKAMEAAGGPEGLAKIVFRKLNLEDAANEVNTLLPAIAAVQRTT